jgi:hypothetical protein
VNRNYGEREMRRSITCVGILTLFCLSFSGLPSRAAEISEELVRKVQPAIVTVLCYNKAGYRYGLGSGFMFRAEAHLITNYHVLGNAAMAKIRTRDGREYNVTTIVGEDKANDLVEAVVDMPQGAVRSLPLAHITPSTGDRVMVVGSPMGVEQTVSVGEVVDIKDVPGHGRVIRYNAHSYHGSSGSPVVNTDGEVVGVVSFGIPPSICYAIPGDRISGLSRVWKTLATVPGTMRARNEQSIPVQDEGQFADTGDPATEVRLALMYEEGKGVSKDCSKALDLYRKASEKGFVQAEFNLGRVYYEGKCVSQNYSEAARWFQKAADRGWPAAQRALGVMHFNGEGMSRDRVRACMWMILAASQGNAGAQRTLRLFAAELTRDEVKQAQELARNWRPSR